MLANMETLADRLKLRRNQLGLTQKAVAREISRVRGRTFSQQAYAALESGDSQMSAEIATISEVLKAPLAWLRDGKGAPPDAGGEPRPTHESAIDADIGRAKNDAAILEVDVRAGAGGGGVPTGVYYVRDDNGNTYQAEGIRDQWIIPSAVVQEMLHAAPKNIRVFEVVGDSMEPRLNEGDRVFVDIRYRVPSPEGIFALWDGIGVVIKRVQVVRGSDPLRLRIISVNTQYEPYEASIDEVNIIGRFAGRFTVF
jgi:phage repressor protein C with HTH and peptisase S24 domain